MKPLTPYEELWLNRGMVIGHWLSKQFGLAHLGYRAFRQRFHEKAQHGSNWQAPAH